MNTSELLEHLEKLRGFAVVAKLRGFHKAAKELHISQPALSRSIGTLETIIGKKLFVRSVRGVGLTDEGKLLLAFFERIESSAGDLVQKIKTGNLPFSGELQVASYETLCAYFWPGFLRIFEQKYPNLRVVLRTDNERDHWQKLSEGSIDVVIDAEPKVDSTWDSYVLYSDRFGLFATKSYESRDEIVDLISVEKAYDEDGLTIRDHFIKGEVAFRESYKLDTFLSVRAFVLEGLGIGAMPLRLVQEDLLKGRLKKISIQGLPEKGFGKHRICFSSLGQNATDSRLTLLRKELKTYLQG